MTNAHSWILGMTLHVSDMYLLFERTSFLIHIGSICVGGAYVSLCVLFLRYATTDIPMSSTTCIANRHSKP